MSKKTEGKGDKPAWAISCGFYTGVLFGMRAYIEENQTAHVFYVPFLDIAFEFYR